MNDRANLSGSLNDNIDESWPSTPSQLVYHLDAVMSLFERIQHGARIDLLEGLLSCVDWREMFGGEGTGYLTTHQLDQLRDYYRARFSSIERFYLAEHLSTELMTAMLASGDDEMSDALKALGRDSPDLWNEIRTFFSRKEFATALLMLADDAPARGPMQ